MLLKSIMKNLNFLGRTWLDWRTLDQIEINQITKMRAWTLEHHKQKLATKRTFFYRIILCTLFSVIITFISLSIGAFGYHYFENLSWVDSLLNASMILGGMGPVTILQTTKGKIFASFYALFSGVVFLVSVSVLIAPVFHRFLHHFHLDNQS